MNCPNCKKEVVADKLFCTLCEAFIPKIGKKAGIFRRGLATTIDSLIAIILFFIVVGILGGASSAIGATLEKLTRSNARNILLMSNNLKLFSYWCVFPKCPNKTAKIPNPFELHLLATEVGIELSQGTLFPYLSCLEDKKLIKNLSVKKKDTWGSWLETVEGEPFQLSEIGQQYLNEKYKFEVTFILDKITGIQYMNGGTKAKCFFSATPKSSDNPFNQCFEKYFDVPSLIHEPYALFDLFDDGWRFKEWKHGGKLKEIKSISMKQSKEKERQTKDKTTDIHHVRKEQESITLASLMRGVKDANSSDGGSNCYKYSFNPGSNTSGEKVK